MNGVGYKGYFMRPIEASHQRYEALRSVLVEEQPMQKVAQRFEISYGTMRNWVSEFCRAHDAGQSPPFSPRHCADVPSPMNPMATKMIRKSKSPMFGHCRWKRDDGCSLGTPASSCSCPCWHSYVSIVLSRRRVIREHEWCRPPMP